MDNITSKLGGLQQVTYGDLKPGDKVTYTFEGSRQISAIEDCPEMIGMPVEVAQSFFKLTVYRAIPVAKQGGLEHEFPGEECCHKGGQGCLGVDCPVAQGVLRNPEPDDVAQPEHTIPQGSRERKDSPMYRGLIGYFPAALFEVATHSMESDKKHNPDSVDGPTWARGKSPDHLDCIIRHLCEVGQRGSDDRIKQLRAVAWRALAALQEECEHQGAKPGVSARFTNG